MNTSIVLQPYEEFKIEIDNSYSPIVVTLVQGNVEYFGLELLLNKEYKFYHNLCYLFSYKGCTLQVNYNSNDENKTGYVVAKSNELWINQLNNIISKNTDVLCNQNILFLGSGSSSKSILYYLLSYIVRLKAIRDDSSKIHYFVNLTDYENCMTISTLNTWGLMEIPKYDNIDSILLTRKITAYNHKYYKLFLQKNNNNNDINGPCIYYSNNNNISNNLDLLYNVKHIIIIGDEKENKNQTMLSALYISPKCKLEINETWKEQKVKNRLQLYFFGDNKKNHKPRSIIWKFNSNSWFRIENDDNDFILENIQDINTIPKYQIIAVILRDTVPNILGFVYIQEYNNIKINTIGGYIQSKHPYDKFITLVSPIAEDFPKNVQFILTNLNYNHIVYRHNEPNETFKEKMAEFIKDNNNNNNNIPGQFGSSSTKQ